MFTVSTDARSSLSLTEYVFNTSAEFLGRLSDTTTEILLFGGRFDIKSGLFKALRGAGRDSGLFEAFFSYGLLGGTVLLGLFVYVFLKADRRRPEYVLLILPIFYPHSLFLFTNPLSFLFLFGLFYFRNYDKIISKV